MRFYTKNRPRPDGRDRFEVYSKSVCRYHTWLGVAAAGYYYGGNKYDNAGGDARYAYNYKAQGSKNGHRKSGVQAKQAGSIIAAGRIVAEGMSAGGRKVRAMRAAGVKAVESSLKVTVKHRRGSFL